MTTERPEWADYMIAYKEVDGVKLGLIELAGGRARIVHNCDQWGYGAFW